MKLHILLDSTKSSYIEGDDIILLCKGNDIEYKKRGILKYVDYELVNENVNVRAGINEWFKTKKEFDKTKNTSYNSFFRTIVAVLFTIEEIFVKYSIDEIVLYGGSRHIYLAAIDSEGEGGKKWYKTNWLVNGIIWSKYNSKQNIRWVGRKPSVFFYIHHLIRYSYFLIRLLGVSMNLHILTKNKSYKHNVFHDVNINGKLFISIVDLPLQYNHIKSLFKYLPENQYVIYTFGKMLANIKRDVVYIPKLSFKEIFNICQESRVKCKGNDFPFENIKASFLSKEMSFLNIQYQLLLRRKLLFLKDKHSDNNVTLVTDMTFGMDIVSCHELAKVNNWFHINVQWVAMGRILFPDLELADKYYLYSLKTYNLYNQYSKSYVYYLPTNTNTDIVKKDRDLVLTIFMQPGELAVDCFEYIKRLLPVIEKQKDIRVVIKPHYRQNRLDELHDIVKPYNFVKIANLNESCESLLNKTSIAVSIISSVIFEALMNNVVCLIYNPNGKYDDVIYHHDVCFPEINFVIKEPSETMDYLNNYAESKILYTKRRQNYIDQYGGEITIKELL